jgi:TonB family protein
MVILISLFGIHDARAAECPVTVDWFWVGAIGSRQGYAQYDIQVRTAETDRYVVRFSVVGTPEDMKHVINARGVDAHTTLLTFLWPTATLGAITIAEVTLMDGSAVRCADAAAVAILNSKDDVRTSFDDTQATWPAEVIGSTVSPDVMTDAALRHFAEPEYPVLDKNAGHQGIVTVEVSVGPFGRPVAVEIRKSSGFPGLDKAALAAAWQNLYSPPTANGMPFVMKYLQEYAFTLR